jgi:phage terminase small subunit
MAALQNVKHERFCLELASGCSQSEAARRAGYSQGRARKTASELMARPVVAARLKELQAETSSARVLNILRRKEELSGIVCREAIPRPLAAITAIAELNKMDRAYEAPKEERPEIKIIEVRLRDDGTEDRRPALAVPGSPGN